MEQQLEHSFYADDTNIRTIGDLNLSYEDYKYLNFKLKGILHYISRVEVMEQYRTCILTTLVFSIRYEKNVTTTLKNYQHFMNQFQQHQLRFCMRMLAETFHEMGLSTYGVRIVSCKELLEILTIHAGLLENRSEEVFELLNNYFSHKQYYLLEEELYSQLDWMLQKIYPYLNLDGNGCCFSHLLKELCEACYIGHMSLEQLYDDFDTLSKQIIEDCYRWYNTYSKTSNNLIKIR